MRSWIITVPLLLAYIAPSHAKAVTTWSFGGASPGMEWTPLVQTNMEVSVRDALEEESNHDLLVVVVPKNTTSFSSGSHHHDALVNNLLENKVKSVVRVVANATTNTSTRLVVVELPSSEEHCGAMGRKVAAAVVTTLKAEKGVKSCAILLPQQVVANSTTSFLSECSSSILTGLYSDTRYKSKVDDSTKHSVETIEFIIPDEALDSGIATDALRRGELVARGVYMAKDIVNAPHNSLNSFGLAATAKKIASQSGGRLSCQILESKDCEKRGMGAFLGVARGSETFPKLIHLTYKPRKKGTKKNPLKKLGVVGKGLLFDTGGYNIKTAMMELMKFDCGGAAAVLGAAQAIAALKPEGVEVHFVIAACENMINERAVVPGDILTASNGKTIEVINTDAEGRLTMADALVYIDKEVGCETIIELSTLTGSCIGALGNAMSGVWTDDEALLDGLKSAAKASGEKLWQMPLEKEYNEQIKSKIADLKNIGGRYGGAITAALFLTNFVENKPFAHIDMAGPVWSTKSGATGWGAKLVTEWVCQEGE